MNEDPGQGAASLLELQAPSFGAALKAQVLKPSCGSDVFEIAKMNFVRRCEIASAVVANGCFALFFAVPRMRKRCRCGSQAMRASPTCPFAKRNVESPRRPGVEDLLNRVDGADLRIAIGFELVVQIVEVERASDFNRRDPAVEPRRCGYGLVRRTHRCELSPLLTTCGGRQQHERRCQQLAACFHHRRVLRKTSGPSRG